MISKIKLSNWRSHFDTELSFSRGVNALVGIMGSGKSSITEAISFGLFGTSPILHSKKATIEEMITAKPHIQNKGFVEIEFSIGGKKYSVRRIIERGKTTEAELRQEGNLIEVGAAAVTKEIERLFGLDYELFSKAIYSEQNGLDHFLRMSKGSRVDHIDKMLKLDRFERAREGAVALANKIKQKREQTLKLVSDLESEKLEQKIKEIEMEIENFEKERKELLDKKLAVLKSLSEISKQLSEYEEIEKLLHKTEKDIERIKASILEAKKIFESKDVTSKEEIQSKIKDLSFFISANEKEVKTIEEQIEEKRNMLAQFNSKLSQVIEHISHLKGLGAFCPICDSEIGEEKKTILLEKRKQEEMELRAEIEKISSEIIEKKKKYSELSVDLTSKRMEKMKLEHELKKFYEMEVLQKRMKEYNETLDSLEKEKETLEKKLEKVSIKDLRNNMQELTGKEREISVKVFSLDERIKDRQSNLADFRKRLDILIGYKSELVADEQVINQLSEFVKILKLTQSQLRDEFVKTINWIMEQIWPELYPYGDFESARLIYDNDYVLQLKETGKEWKHVDGIASGGERSMACLALRIAFAHAFSSSFRWLILDEPTHNLDAQAIQQFTDILRERIEEFAEQIFIITHEERLSEGLIGQVYKIERDKSRSGSSRVLQIN